MMLSSHRIPPSIIAGGYNGQTGIKSPPHHVLGDRVNITSERTGAFHERTGILHPGLLSERKSYTNDRSIFTNEKSNFANDRAKFVPSQSFPSDRPRISSSDDSLFTERVPKERSALNERMISPPLNERTNLPSSRQNNGYSERHYTSNGRSYEHEDGKNPTPSIDRRSPPSTAQRTDKPNHTPNTHAPNDSTSIHNDLGRKSKSPHNHQNFSTARQPLHPSFNKTSIFKGEILTAPTHTNAYAERRDFDERFHNGSQRSVQSRSISPKQHTEHSGGGVSHKPPRYMYHIPHIPQSRHENISNPLTQKYNSNFSVISTNSNNRPIMAPTMSSYETENRRFNPYENHRFEKSSWKNYTYPEKNDDYRTSSFATKSIHAEKHTISYTQPFSQSENIQARDTLVRDRSPTIHRQNINPYANNNGYPTFAEPPGTQGRSIHDRQHDRQSDLHPGKPDLSNGCNSPYDNRSVLPNKRARFSRSPPSTRNHPNSSDYGSETRNPREMVPSPERDIRPVAEHPVYPTGNRNLQDRSSIFPDRLPPMLLRNDSRSPDINRLSTGKSPQAASPVPQDRKSPNLSETTCTMSEIQPLYPKGSEELLNPSGNPKSRSPASVSRYGDATDGIPFEEKPFSLINTHSFSESKTETCEIETCEAETCEDSSPQQDATTPNELSLNNLSNEMSQNQYERLKESRDHSSSPHIESRDEGEGVFVSSRSPHLSEGSSRSPQPSEGAYESSRSPHPAVLILKTEADNDDYADNDSGTDNNADHDGAANDPDSDHQDEENDEDVGEYDFDDYEASTTETIEYGEDIVDENNNVIDDENHAYPDYDGPEMEQDRPSMLADDTIVVSTTCDNQLTTTQSLTYLSRSSDRPSMISDCPSMVSVISDRPSMLSDSPSMVSASCVRPSLLHSDVTNGDENLGDPSAMTSSDKACVVKRGKRKKYQKYTPADRIAIGKFCFEHGPAAARKAFQSRYPEMSESVTRGFRDKYKLMIGEYAVYCFEQKRRREMAARNESLPRGRPRKYKPIEIPAADKTMPSVEPNISTSHSNGPPETMTSSPTNPVSDRLSTDSTPPLASSNQPVSSSHRVPSPDSDSLTRASSEPSSLPLYQTNHHGSPEPRPPRSDDVTDDVGMVNDRPQVSKGYTREDMLTIGWFCAKHGRDIALRVFSEEHPDLTYDKVVEFHKFYLESEGHVVQGEHSNVVVVEPERNPVNPSPNGFSTYPADVDPNQTSFRNGPSETRERVESSIDRKSSERELDATSKPDDVSSNNSEIYGTGSPVTFPSRDLVSHPMTSSSHPMTSPLTSPHTRISPIIHYPKISSENSFKAQGSVEQRELSVEQREFKQEELAHAPKLEQHRDNMAYPYDRSLYMFGHENLTNGSPALPRTKRFKYQKYSPEDRFNIGKLCNDIGLGATVKVYREQFPRLNESVVRTFRNKYRELLQKGNGVPVAEAIERKPSRRSVTSLIENDVVSQLRQFKESNIDLTDKLVIAVAENIIATKDEKEIGPVKNTVTKEWATSLLWKHKLVERQCSNPNGVCCQRCKTPLVCPKC